LKIIFNNFGKSLLFLVWVICGCVAVLVEDPGTLTIAVLLTIGYALTKSN